MNLPSHYALKPNEVNILETEIRALSIPFDNFQIAERCHELESLLKVVNYQLSFNVMKHSIEFGRLSLITSSGWHAKCEERARRSGLD